MKKLASLLLVVCALASVHAQTPKKKSEWTSGKNPMVGTFALSGKGADMKGGMVKITGTVVGKMDVGGKWFTQDVTMKMGKEPAHGRMQIGYDEASKTYVSSWIDDMAAVIITAKGTREGNVVTMTSDETDVMGQKMKFKIILTLKDKNTYTELVQADMGSGFTTIEELTCKRVIKKAAPKPAANKAVAAKPPVKEGVAKKGN